MKKLQSCFCFVFVLTLFSTANSRRAPQVVGAAPDGEAVYKTNCTRCHNTPPSLTERQTRVVVSHMRVRANLTESDARAVLRYLAENSRGN